MYALVEFQTHSVWVRVHDDIDGLKRNARIAGGRVAAVIRPKV